MRGIAGPSRWLWGVSGLVTVVALGIPGIDLITSAGVPGNQYAHPQPGTVTRTVTVRQLVTSVDVQSYGAPVQVTAEPVRRVQVSETIFYDPQEGGAPAVTHSVSGGRLTLADPACNFSNCSVSFTVTVPRTVAVTVASESGSVAISGTAGATLDSGGGSVSATGIDGPLSVATQGGPLVLNGLTGPLRADTAGGSLLAQDVVSQTATAITGGGPARIEFTVAPETVFVSTGGGPATVDVPRGPYALTVDSQGGSQLVGIASDPAARRTITVTSGGGPLQIGP